MKNIYSIVVPAFCQLVVFWSWSNFVLPIRLRDLEMDKLSISDERDTNIGDMNSLC